MIQFYLKKNKRRFYYEIKTLALISGIVGLVGGILLLIGPFVLLGTAVNTAATTLNGGSYCRGCFRCCLTLECLEDLKILFLVSLLLFTIKGDNRCRLQLPSVLMIVSGGVSLISILRMGWGFLLLSEDLYSLQH